MANMQAKILIFQYFLILSYETNIDQYLTTYLKTIEKLFEIYDFKQVTFYCPKLFENSTTFDELAQLNRKKPAFITTVLPSGIQDTTSFSFEEL